MEKISMWVPNSKITMSHDMHKNSNNIVKDHLIYISLLNLVILNGKCHQSFFAAVEPVLFTKIQIFMQSSHVKCHVYGKLTGQCIIFSEGIAKI